MTVKNAGSGAVDLANGGKASLKTKVLRKMLSPMAITEKEPVDTAVAKGRVGRAPSRTVKLSNGMVLKMVRRDVYNRVVRGRAA